MQLSDFQRSLILQIQTRCSPHAEIGGKDQLQYEATADWEANIRDSTGLAVTCEIQRWWRSVRIKTTAVFTIHMLESLGLAAELDVYLQHHACQTLFILPECLAFLTFIAGRQPLPAAVRHTAGFERAVLSLRMLANAEPEQQSEFVAKDFYFLKLSQNTGIEYLPTALVDAQSPAKDCEFLPVVVSPKIHQFWRPLKQQEYELMKRIDSESVLAVNKLAPAEHSIADNLMSEGTICYLDKT